MIPENSSRVGGGGVLDRPTWGPRLLVSVFSDTSTCACIQKYVYVYIYIGSMYVCMYVCRYICIYPYIHRYIHTYVHTYLHTYTITYIYTYNYTRMHKYIPTHIHYVSSFSACVYTHVCIIFAECVHLLDMLYMCTHLYTAYTLLVYHDIHT